MKNNVLLLLLFIALSKPLSAQVSFQFFPELFGRSVDGLLNCALVNLSGKAQVVTLTVTVSEKGNGTVVVIKTAGFNLLPGTNRVPAYAARGARIDFKGGLGTSTRQHTYFPEGSYEYCFTLTPAAAGAPVSNECFSYELTPFAPLSLVQPYNKDQVCEKRPMLSWQPSVPAIAGSNYQLVLAEIKTGQTPAEALNYNLPIINQYGIIAPVLPYPSISNELETGKRYAWQVSAYKDQTVINRSEIWEFMVNCESPVEKVMDDNGYRDIEDLVKGNYYLAVGKINYIVVNPYGEQELIYTIKCVTDPSIKIKKLPKVSLKTAKNKVTVDLSANRAFKDGYSYIMTLRIPDGSTRNLRFIFKEPLQ